MEVAKITQWKSGSRDHSLMTLVRSRPHCHPGPCKLAQPRSAADFDLGDLYRSCSDCDNHEKEDLKDDVSPQLHEMIETSIEALEKYQSETETALTRVKHGIEDMTSYSETLGCIENCKTRIQETFSPLKKNCKQLGNEVKQLEHEVNHMKKEKNDETKKYKIERKADECLISGMDDQLHYFEKEFLKMKLKLEKLQKKRKDLEQEMERKAIEFAMLSTVHDGVLKTKIACIESHRDLLEKCKLWLGTLDNTQNGQNGGNRGSAHKGNKRKFKRKNKAKAAAANAANTKNCQDSGLISSVKSSILQAEELIQEEFSKLVQNWSAWDVEQTITFLNVAIVKCVHDVDRQEKYRSIMSSNSDKLVGKLNQLNEFTLNLLGFENQNDIETICNFIQDTVVKSDKRQRNKQIQMDDKCDMCLICVENKVNMVFVDCGHMCYCQKCYMDKVNDPNSSEKICCQCHTASSSVIKVFVSGLPR